MGFSFTPFLGGMFQQFNTITDAGRVHKARLGELEVQHGYSLKQLQEQHKLAILRDDKSSAAALDRLIKEYELRENNDKELAKLQSDLKKQELTHEYGLKEDYETHKFDLEDLLDSDYTKWGVKLLSDVGLPSLKLKTSFDENELKGGTAFNQQLAQINSWSNESLKMLRDGSSEEFADILRTVNGIFKDADRDSIRKTDAGKGYIKLNWFKGLDNIKNLEGVGSTFEEFINTEIRGKEIHDWTKRDGKFYDDVILEVSPDGKTFDSKPLSYDDLAINAGFIDKVAMFKAAEPLAGFGVNAGSKDAQDLSKFIRSMVTNKVSLATLQLAPEIDYLQELSFDNIDEMSPAFYSSLKQKIDTINKSIIENAAKNNIKPDLIDMDDVVWMIATTSSEKEHKYGDIITDTNHTRDMKGADWKYNDEARQSQYDAAGKVKVNIRQLKDNVREMGSTVGLPSLWAEVIMKVKSTGEGFGMLIGDFKTAVNNGQIVDTNGTMHTIFAEMANFQKEAQGANKAAQLKAQQNFLKFSIAYQLSMALQGGSGGRTISDQDVQNILQALNMETLMANPDLMISALDIIDEFANGLQAMSKWDKTTVKGFRTATHARELFFAEGSPRSTEELLTKFQENGIAGEAASSIGPVFSNYNIQTEDLFGTAVPMAKLDRWEDENGNFHPVLYFGDNERFGNYRGKALLATSDMVREYLDAFYKYGKINLSSQKLFEERFEMSSVDLDPSKPLMIINPITEKKTPLLFK